MKLGILLVLCTLAHAALADAALAAPAADEPAPVALAWFTDARIGDGVRVASPTARLPEAKGGFGTAVQVTKAVAVDSPTLSQTEGYISFWIRPNWSGNDGKTHRILRIGDPEHNGLLVEKSAKNMLRYVMASPEKVSASRSDVSNWKAGEWHHIVIAWTLSREGIPQGLPLWIDRVTVDGPIASGNTFLNPAKMDDARLWIGDETTDAAIDELIMRARPTDGRTGGVRLVYRDYFRTAPYTQIAIDPEPHAVPADRRVVAGFHKQFGLRGKLNGRWERTMEFISGHGNWTDFDAKPLITWSTSDAAIATVNEDGRVDGRAIGRCTLTAEFHGTKATYDIHVIPVEQPDLDLYLVERQPRYLAVAVKNKPEPGDVVKSVARIVNAGYKPTPSGVPVVFELIPEANGNYRLDADEQPIATQQATINKSLAPFEETTVEFTWTWPKVPVWVRVTVDPRNGVSEISEANNQLIELNTAKSVIWGHPERVPPTLHADRRINLTGSFSYYDWMRAHTERLRLMLREAVYPTTSPIGVLEDYRVDEFIDFVPGAGPDRPYEHHLVYHDGGFPLYDPKLQFLDSIWATAMHEMGHTMLALPDLYGYPVRARNIFITDENGARYAGGPLLPRITSWDAIMFSNAQGVECGGSYSYLMDCCHMVLHPALAGQVHYYRGCRGPRFWGVHGRLIPTTRHELLVLDVNDEPLAGAAVYCYQVNDVDGAGDASARFFPDRPKFIGTTGEQGVFVFPDRTDKDWDSPDTDEVDGDIDVWNPFGRARKDTPNTPSCHGCEGMILVKLVSGPETEFHWLTLGMLNEAFFAGAKNRGVYTIRTSVKPQPEPTAVVRRPVPDAIREQNLAPVATVKEGTTITVAPNEVFRLDGSESYDPEGQPLEYRWSAHWAVDRDSRSSDKPVYEGKAFREPCEYTIVFWVLDGVRASNIVRVRVRVLEGGAADADADMPTGGAWWENYANWKRQKEKAAEEAAAKEEAAKKATPESTDTPTDE